MPQTSPMHDKSYDLVSVLYHASQSVDTCSQYMDDAKRENDQELMQFLQEAQQQNSRIAEKAKELLKNRL